MLCIQAVAVARSLFYEDKREAKKEEESIFRGSSCKNYDKQVRLISSSHNRKSLTIFFSADVCKWQEGIRKRVEKRRKKVYWEGMRLRHTFKHSIFLIFMNIDKRRSREGFLLHIDLITKKKQARNACHKGIYLERNGIISFYYHFAYIKTNWWEKIFSANVEGWKRQRRESFNILDSMLMRVSIVSLT